MRLGHVIWGLVCLLLMGWGFVLGLWVGQGSLATPEQVAGLRQWVSFLPGLREPAPEAAENGADKQAQPSTPPQLSFYDNLEKGEAPPPVQVAGKPAEPLPATPPPAAPAAPPAAPPPPAAKPPEARPAQPFQPVPKPFVPSPAAPASAQAPGKPPVAPGPQPAAKPAPPTAQAPPAAPARQGRYTVQVASFKEEDQARELLAQLKGGGHPAYMVPVRLEGVGTRYRVRVGPFYDFDVAQGAAGRIRLQLTLAAYVTRED